jgi:hypothetical protein
LSNLCNLRALEAHHHQGGLGRYQQVQVDGAALDVIEVILELDQRVLYGIS